MSLADVCDLAYTLLADRVREAALAERQATLIASVFAAEDAGPVELPDPDDAVERLDEALLAEDLGGQGQREDLDPVTADLLVALRLRR